MLAYKIVIYKVIVMKVLNIGVHRILFLPDIRPAEHPANPKAGYPAGYLA
jgi:hypothetical protein